MLPTRIPASTALPGVCNPDRPSSTPRKVQVNGTLVTLLPFDFPPPTEPPPPPPWLLQKPSTERQRPVLMTTRQSPPKPVVKPADELLNLISDVDQGLLHLCRQRQAQPGLINSEPRDRKGRGDGDRNCSLTAVGYLVGKTSGQVAEEIGQAPVPEAFCTAYGKPETVDGQIDGIQAYLCQKLPASGAASHPETTVAEGLEAMRFYPSGTRFVVYLRTRMLSHFIAAEKQGDLLVFRDPQAQAYQATDDVWGTWVVDDVLSRVETPPVYEGKTPEHLAFVAVPPPASDLTYQPEEAESHILARWHARRQAIEPLLSNDIAVQSNKALAGLRELLLRAAVSMGGDDADVFGWNLCMQVYGALKALKDYEQVDGDTVRALGRICDRLASDFAQTIASPVGLTPEDIRNYVLKVRRFLQASCPNAPRSDAYKRLEPLLQGDPTPELVGNVAACLGRNSPPGLRPWQRHIIKTAAGTLGKTARCA